MCVETAIYSEKKKTNDKITEESLELQANPLSKTFFQWAQPLFTKANKLHSQNKALEQDDLLNLSSIDYADVVVEKFEASWKEEQNIVKAIRAVIGKRFAMAGCIKVVNTLLQFTFPILLSNILQFMETTESQTNTSSEWYIKYKGYWLSALLFVAMALKAITENTYFHQVYRSGYQTRTSISVAIYNKSLRLSSSERNTKTLGELINLMQVDATKVEMFLPQFHVLWDGLLQITGYMIILYSLIGWPCFAGLVVMICAGPVQGMIMKRLFGLNRSMVKYTDSRVKTTNEAVQGIRCVKMYTWEESFLNVISKSRSKELEFMSTVAYLRGFSRAYMGALPGIVAVASFIMYALVYKNAIINASTLFAALVAFEQLRFPLLFYPMSLAQYAQAKVSAKRVEEFLRLKEVVYDDVDNDNKNALYKRHDPSLQCGEVTLKDINVYWSDPDIPSETKVDEKTEQIYPSTILQDISLQIKSKELCAIVGSVGCGKSTLCSTILNETITRGDSIKLNGTIAYVAQSPWILNATLRDNILFGKPYEEEKYNEIIKACQLTHDLSLLDHGDMTEIGENGINLSGGQKQRVSIARAAYANADIVILDDPLSALDPEVGKKLFDECILGYMQSKTRILVTNQLQCLKFCDSVVALGEGKILEYGSYEELRSGNGEVQRLLQELKVGHEDSPKDSTVVEPEKEEKSDEAASTNKPKKNNANLVTKEERNIGAVSWQVYKKYVIAGGGYFRFLISYLMFVLCATNSFMSNAWISLWTADSTYQNNSRFFYLGYYSLFSVTLGVFTFFRSYFLAKFGVNASGTLHKNLLASVLNAPMSFFDTTPTGRILSRFSKDTYAIDMEMSDCLDFFLFCSLTVAVSLGTISVITPYFAIAIIPLAFIYVKVLNYFREVSRETKRLDSISRSPVFAHFSETLGGLGTIRAYDQSTRFIGEFEVKVNGNTRAYYNNKTADRWLSVRLELLGATVGGLAATFASHVVISNAASSTSRENFASIAGLSLTYAISVTGLLNWVVRSFAQMEAAMNAAERILYYTENIPQEAPSNVKDLKKLSNESSNGKDSTLIPAVLAVKAKGGAEMLDKAWPSKGNITLNNLKMRYRPENPLVINGLDIQINGGERVGVVGRTGSGKSSLMLTLLRIVEPALFTDGDEAKKYEAPIVIDGVDVLRIGLTDLRSKIGIIPQNPVLFSGTIRSNMDPFNQSTDDQIWNALDRCGMKKVILEMPERLSAPVAEYGENLSQGQRQLLCLGRALLKKCHILLLDEATSSVDYETDATIQKTLREDFVGCTVLTIAHRVNTIMDSDKILVMKDGKVGEFDSPEKLLEDEGSIFYDIVKHSRSEHH